MPKSNSTPAALYSPSTAATAGGATAVVSTSAAAVPTTSVQQPSQRPSKPRSKSRSLGNLQSKSKLQLLYRPPFKLTVKLKKKEDSRAAAAAITRGRTALLISLGGKGEKARAANRTKQEVVCSAEDQDVSTVPSDRTVLISGPTVS
jgi:hypothetical protein